jgi:hypothetical protein
LAAIDHFSVMAISMHGCLAVEPRRLPKDFAGGTDRDPDNRFEHLGSELKEGGVLG